MGIFTIASSNNDTSFVTTNPVSFICGTPNGVRGVLLFLPIRKSRNAIGHGMEKKEASGGEPWWINGGFNMAMTCKEEFERCPQKNQFGKPNSIIV